MGLTKQHRKQDCVAFMVDIIILLILLFLSCLCRVALRKVPSALFYINNADPCMSVGADADLAE